MSLQKFLASRTGRRFYNFCYCWGACLVILGAVLKIMHAPYDNLFLMIGLGTEVFIFFISGFDEPSREYKWERVFPILNNKNANTDPEVADWNVKTELRTGVEYSKAIGKLNKNVETLNVLYINKLNELYEAQIKQIKAGNNTAGTDMQNMARKLSEDIATLNGEYKKMLDTMK